eukprot:TRINITY_DN994_c0_g1_i1.p1 TRINITY_DN994_c0_g1~~TRINITY_DN994_c0_g1_i1.p1  ORF type:complete len:195 (+),score=46.30 TRINITY_DN994_c0_g1_i1:35-586(+)
MSTDAQRERLTGLFHFFDADGNGVLTKEDFEKGGVRYGESLGKPHDSPVCVAYRENFMKMWDAIKALDTNKDNQVSKDEFLTGLVSWMKADSSNGLGKILESWTDIIFKTFESSEKKGTLSPKEFQTIAIIADEAQARKVFDVIDVDKNGFISEKEFKDFCHSYFFDPSSKYDTKCFFTAAKK